MSIYNFTFGRSKFPVIFNVLGLSVAFAAFYVIITQVLAEYNFDKNYKDSERIYRIEMFWDNNWMPTISRPIYDLITTGTPQIQDKIIIYEDNDVVSMCDNGETVGYSANILYTTPNILNFFDYKIMDGAICDFNTNNEVVMPRSIANFYFGDKSILGNTLSENGNSDAVIVAVYEDFAENSSRPNAIIKQIGDLGAGIWGQFRYTSYLKLFNNVESKEVEKNLNAKFQNANIGEWTSDVRFRLTPIGDIYFQSDTVYDSAPKGNQYTTFILLTVAILIITIATINYVNLAMIIIPMRIGSINIYKIFGKSTIAIRKSIIVEAIVLSLIAMVLSYVWVSLLSDTSVWLNFFHLSMTFYTDLVLNFAFVILAILIGVIAGILPAIYITKFSPAIVLKGAFGNSTKGKLLRTILLSIQFAISMTLVIWASFLNIQNHYVSNFDVGYSTDNLLVVTINENIGAKHQIFTEKLKKNHLIADVGFTYNVFGSNNYDWWESGCRGENENDQKMVSFDCISVSKDLLKVMGLEVIEGRDFNDDDEHRESGAYIFNEAAQKKYNLTLNTSVGAQAEDYAPIVGFVKDFNYKSLRYNITPMALFLTGSGPIDKYSTAIVKVNGDVENAIGYIESTAKEIDPLYSVAVSRYSDVYDTLYKREISYALLITLFSILAIIISLMGILGLTIFEMQFRIREIVIRKVFGATTMDVLLNGSKKLIVVLFISALFAIPVAYLCVSDWLSGFVYHTPIYWWVFGLALLIMILLTIIIVIIFSWKVASVNPVKVIKH